LTIEKKTHLQGLLKALIGFIDIARLYFADSVLH